MFRCSWKEELSIVHDLSCDSIDISFVFSQLINNVEANARGNIYIDHITRMEFIAFFTKNSFSNIPAIPISINAKKKNKEVIQIAL